NCSANGCVWGYDMKAMLGVVLFGLIIGCLWAQEDRATVIGQVTDSTGAVIVGAKIRIVSIDTGIETSAASNADGGYLAASLPAGRYSISAEATGFKRVENRDVVLRIQQIARFDFALEVGNISETVSVAAKAPLLTTDDVTLGQGLDSKNALELPV